MIIELTGIPGSGKSTILQKLKEKLQGDIYIFDIQNHILGFNSNTPVYDLFLVVNFFRLSRVDWNLLKSIVKLLFNSKDRFFHKVNIIRNSYKKLVINQFFQNSDNIVFIDEGLSHIPLNVFVNENSNLSDSDLKDFLQTLKINNKVLLIDVDDKILLDRVLERGQKGHRRMDFSNEKKVRIFMEESRKILEAMKTKHKFVEFINEAENININQIIKELEIE